MDVTGARHARKFALAACIGFERNRSGPPTAACKERLPIAWTFLEKTPISRIVSATDESPLFEQGWDMNENEPISSELKELEYNIAYLANEKQKGWLSTTKQDQLARDRMRRDEMLAEASEAATV
jgi:hypothetical protein